MRLVSVPHASLQTAPVAAAERANARGRERMPLREDVENPHGERGEMRIAIPDPAKTPRRYLQADAALVGIGLTAQNMYHSENGGPAEESIIRAAKAYAETDGMKYRQAPFSYRVA